jgi:hypothetical protein
MKQQYSILILVALATTTHADIFGTGPNQFSINFVDIGNPGNVADAPINTLSGMRAIGSVAYRYRIGQSEVTIDQFMKARAADGRIGNGNENYWNDGTRTGGVNAPASYTTWHEAAKFCNWLTTGDAYAGVYQYDAGGVLQAVDRSYRNGFGLAYVLPTEDEWHKAAYFDASGSGGYSLYAHGADTTPLRGTNGWNYSLGAGNWVNPAPNYVWQPGTGGLEQNGTFDMMGNVREWNESANDGTLDNMEEGRVYRGGAYLSVEYYLSSAEHSGTNPPLEWHSRGFRVAAIPEPGTVGLMGIGSGILLFTRRHRRRRARGTRAVRMAKTCSCDVFDPSAETVVVHRRDFWDFLDSCTRIASRTKASSLRIFDAFLALIMK